jgi:hypothetical protein
VARPLVFAARVAEADEEISRLRCHGLITFQI